MTLKTTLFAAAAVMALTSTANAYEGLYGAIGAGLAYPKADQDVESVSGGPYQWDGDADYDNGIGIYTALGYDYGSNWRTELEFSYRANDIRHIAGDNLGFGGWSGGTIDGEMTTQALLANAIYDFDFGDSFVTPYVGLGVGFARIKGEFNGSSQSGDLLIDDKDGRLAYQGIAGLAFALAENLSLDLSYRYFATQETKFSGSLEAIAQDVNFENVSHSLFAGLRWNFGAASAPAAVQYKDCWDGSSVPVSAECPPQVLEETAASLDPVDIIVYFDYDKSNLTPEASELIREAAARALANNIETVKVEGNADRSGGSAYNQALSERRANVVRDALIANGVPADRIETSSFGEDNPAKPTPDGVREPLNRRTEVTISFE